MLRRIALLPLAAAAIACGASAASTGSAASSAETTPRRDRTVILAEDMQTVQALNLYEVVQRIHPEWLTSRNTSTSGQRTGKSMNTDYEIQVYIDTQRAGTVEILKTMAIRGASSLRYYTASDAQVHFGSGNLNGAIQVITTK